MVLQFLVWRRTLTLVFEAGNSNRDHYGDKTEPPKDILSWAGRLYQKPELLENITHMFGFDL